MNATWLQPLTAIVEQAAHDAIKDKCCCLEYVGDNPSCPIHGRLYRGYCDCSIDETEAQLHEAGYGSAGIL